MSELDKKIWAVISERGVEASGLSYGAALNLSRTLETEKIHGLCVVTNSAARRSVSVSPEMRKKVARGKRDAKRSAQPPGGA